MYTNDDFHPAPGSCPSHIALIPDGGRRWAKLHGCSNRESYELSLSKLEEMIGFLFSYPSVRYLSIYFASTQNFRRSEKEIADFSDTEWSFINGKLSELSAGMDFNIRIVGNIDSNTAGYSGLFDRYNQAYDPGRRTVYICYNYNSLDEIENACRQAEGSGISFVNYLSVPHPVNLLIRTGGANVLSGFLMPQASYARLFFLESLFNDTGLSDIERIMSEYMGFTLKYGS